MEAPPGAAIAGLSAPLPQFQLPPLDANFAALAQQTDQQDINALMQRARDDTASLLARYGSQLALGGGTRSPLTG